MRGPVAAGVAALLIAALSPAPLVGRAATGASLQASPSSVVPGQRFDLRGSGFKPGETIILYWDGVRLAGSDRVIDNGTLSGAYAFAPLSTGSGRHSVQARGGGGDTATAQLVVPSPALHDVPLLMATGQRFGISGTGFAARDYILFYWDGARLPGWHAQANGAGSFTNSVGHVPGGAAPGVHIFLAKGLKTGRSAQVRVTIGTGGAAATATGGPVAAAATATSVPATSTPGSASARNAIQVENAQTGTADWGVTRPSTGGHRIEGYADHTSVDVGGQIGLYVNENPAGAYTLDVYRMGWYGGLGARLMLHVPNLTGSAQPTCPTDSARGTTVCAWARSYTLSVPSAWTSGVYLARLTRADGYQSYIIFVVRNDAGTSALLFQTSVLTYQAYNDWGGNSLYGATTGTAESGSATRAYAVSFDRPYARGYGAGDFFFWEYPMLRWLEANGYDVSYSTDIDTDASPDLLSRHRALLVVGHDEYWTRAMYDNVQHARDQGVSLGFFGGNIDFWQARLESSPLGASRILVCYKDKTLDPDTGAHNDLVTVKWRDPLLNRPEQALIGQMWESWFHSPTSFPLKATNAQAWPYAGTGVHDGDSIPGMVGYEYDRVFPNVPTPAGEVILATSPVVNVNGTPSVSNVTLYTAPSGARVFSAGTIQWSWGLDDEAMQSGIDVWSTHHTASFAARKLTANILDNFIAGH